MKRTSKILVFIAIVAMILVVGYKFRTQSELQQPPAVASAPEEVPAAVTNEPSPVEEVQAEQSAQNGKLVVRITDVKFAPSPGRPAPPPNAVVIVPPMERAKYPPVVME